jgi:hypothetical protein
MYIGNSPLYQSFPRDRFNGGAASYTLTYNPQTPGAILVIVDGVVQDATNDYTTSGTTLTPTTVWPAGTNNVVVIYLGRSADIGTPSDDTVSIAKLQSAVLQGMRGNIAGLTLSNNGSDATNDIDIAAGSAVDSSVADVLVLASALTKQLDAAWAVGTNAGGLDTGAIANGTYHVFLIKNPTTGVVDALFSASATAPTMPSGYTLKRRIGSILRESAAIVTFKQAGDLFQRLTPVLDVNATNPGASAVSRTLSVPTGLNVRAGINVAIQAGTGGAGTCAYFSDLDTTDVAAARDAMPLTSLVAESTGSVNAGPMYIRTNTSAQIRSRMSNSAASDVLRITTLGWIDTRGRDE